MLDKQNGALTKAILLIDDEKDMDWVMRQILTDAGYEVLTAKTGAEGLSKFKKYLKKIGLVLLDIRLPDISGLDLLSKIKTISRHTNVLMITAFGTPGMRKLAKKKGALDVLDKPFRVEKILKIAREIFEEKRLGGGQKG